MSFPKPEYRLIYSQKPCVRLERERERECKSKGNTSPSGFVQSREKGMVRESGGHWRQRGLGHEVPR